MKPSLSEFLFSKPAVSALLLFSFAATSPAAQTDGPPLNTEAILRELEALEKKQEQLISSAKNAAINALRPAAQGGSAATNLYIQAVEATRFEGVKNKGSEFLDWKKENESLLDSKAMQAAIALNVRYLLLSIERGASEDADAFAAPSLAYTDELVKNQPSGGSGEKVPNEARELLDKPASESIFAQWLNLGPFLPKADIWEMTPGNLAGILEKNVRAPWRKSGNPKLIDTWAFQMRVEADRITDSRLAHSADSFNTIKLPAMQFSRANDLAALGMKNSAASEILAIARKYPQHADLPKWIARLKELLAQPPAMPQPAETTPAAPNP